LRSFRRVALRELGLRGTAARAVVAGRSEDPIRNAATPRAGGSGLRHGQSGNTAAR
jgi:hypothetical protein